MIACCLPCCRKVMIVFDKKANVAAFATLDFAGDED